MLSVSKRDDLKIKPQLAIAEEFNHKHAFGEELIDKVKLLFEGKGADIRNNYYKCYNEQQFKGTRFVLASNSLPLLAEAKYENHPWH